MTCCMNREYRVTKIVHVELLYNNIKHNQRIIITHRVHENSNIYK